MSWNSIRSLFALILLASIIPLNLLASSASYCYFRETTLINATEKLTIQQPATSPKSIQFVGGSIYCSAGCTVTLDRSGRAATATPDAATKINMIAEEPTASIFVGSNAGAGVTINKFVLAAGQTLLIDLAHLVLSSPSDNLNFSTSQMTGDVKIFLLWREQ